MSPPDVGLLPLYVRFYDEVLPDLLGQLEPFLERVRSSLEAGGLRLLAAPVGRTREDFARAVEHFEGAGADAILTLHLAYSPSLESADVLAATPLPVILLDTTPDREFGPGTDPGRLLFNHGVHGLQDLASVLRRKGKPYRVVAGHLDDPELVPRCARFVRAARAARAMHRMRALRIGGVFPGMGDFAVDDAVLREKLGIAVENIIPSALAGDIAGVQPSAVAAEMDADRERYRVCCPPEVHERSVRVGLGLRRFLERGPFGAFSLNFLSFQDSDGPVSTVPFLECCQAMARGIGYAGEGDVLTASLVGALARGFGAATFTEIFCADWAGQSLFLSHMGELNPAQTADVPVLYEKEFPFTPARNPATLAGAPRPGPATFVNLAPGPGGSFHLIAAPVEVLADGTHPDLPRWVRGWIRPPAPLERFLEDYSHLGGTHHAALVPGHHGEALAALATFLKIDFHLLA